MKRMATALALLIFLSFADLLAAQQATTTRIKIRSRDATRDAKKAQQVDQDGTLSLDDGARVLIARPENRPARELKYDDAAQVIIEPDSHAGNIGFGAALVGFAAGGMLFGGKIATAIDTPMKVAHVVYVEPKGSDGPTAAGGWAGPLVLILGKDEAPEGLKRLHAAFGDRIVLPSFEEAPEKLEKKLYKSTETLQLRAHAQEHPLPELRPDKALVVVASPLGGSFRPVEKGKWTPFFAKVLAGDRLMTVNAPGSYSFFYLEPGEHLLVSQAMVNKKLVDVTGLRIKVEAGRDYYLMQTIFIGGGMKSFLTRHAREIVMQEVSELLWSEWRVKD